MTPSLEEIKALTEQFAGKIKAPPHLLPTFGYSVDGAHPHVEIDSNGQLYYVIVERGQELKRLYAVDTDDLLYRIFADLTFSLAVDFELNHRIETQDGRRIIFARQDELLEALSAQWKQRMTGERRQILRSHPFDDLANARASYSRELRESGMTSAAAWSAACHRYPLPEPD